MTASLGEPDPTTVAALAPRGRLRAAINLGNPILAGRDPISAEPVGVSVDLVRDLAARLGVEVELKTFTKAAASVDAVRAGDADIGFFALDPARSEGLLFTAAYVLIEGSYLVDQDSTITDNADVDRSGHRVSVGSGSAYDLFLTRTLQRAQIVRLDGAPAAMAALRSGEVEVAAGIRQVLVAESHRQSGTRMLSGRFMVIQQAMGLPAGRGRIAQTLLADFVQARILDGFVSAALARHHVDGALVAPSTDPSPSVS